MFGSSKAGLAGGSSQSSEASYLSYWRGGAQSCPGKHLDGSSEVDVARDELQTKEYAGIR